MYEHERRRESMSGMWNSIWLTEVAISFRWRWFMGLFTGNLKFYSAKRKHPWSIYAVQKAKHHHTFHDLRILIPVRNSFTNEPDSLKTPMFAQCDRCCEPTQRQPKLQNIVERSRRSSVSWSFIVAQVSRHSSRVRNDQKNHKILCLFKKKLVSCILCYFAPIDVS